MNGLGAANPSFDLCSMLNVRCSNAACRHPAKSSVAQKCHPISRGHPAEPSHSYYSALSEIEIAIEIEIEFPNLFDFDTDFDFDKSI